MEKTLVLLKPDAVQRGLVGRLLARFEDKGLAIRGLRLLNAPQAVLETHYAVHKERPFYPSLMAFMSSGPVVAVALEGDGAIGVVRRLMGETDGRASPPGTIRGDFGLSRSSNLVHGSDGPEAAALELSLWFPEGLAEYDLGTLGWVYEGTRPRA